MDKIDLTFQKILPQTQYLGSKQKLINWIINRLPLCNTVFDAFSGSGVVAFHLKKLGKEIICNDFLKSSYLFAKAFIENNNITLSREEVEKLLLPNPDKQDYIERYFTDVFYTREECIFLDNLHASILELDNEYKQAIAFASALRTCVQKIPGGKFRANLFKYRDKNFVHFRPKYAKNITNTFKEFLIGYNNAVFDNGKQNLAFNENVFKILPKITANLVYFDPPYGGSGFNYEKDYFFLEVFTKYYDKIKEFHGVTKTYKKFQDSGFTKSKEIYKSFTKLFKLADHIPIWIISYNTRSIPKFDNFVELISQFRNIEGSIYQKNYHYKIGKSTGLKEILFVCKPK